MALTKIQKKEIVTELEHELKDAETIVFVNFKGLTVGDTNKLRRSLQAAGVKYKVAKKTLLARVLADKKVGGSAPELAGEVAIAYGTDALAPAREVYAFSKGRETPKIVGGVFGGEFADGIRMMSIATIPPREVLLAQFVNLINSPIQRFAVVLNAIADKKA